MQPVVHKKNDQYSRGHYKEIHIAFQQYPLWYSGSLPGIFFGIMAIHEHEHTR